MMILALLDILISKQQFGPVSGARISGIFWAYKSEWHVCNPPNKVEPHDRNILLDFLIS